MKIAEDGLKEQIVLLYDKGLLTENILRCLLEPYKGCQNEMNASEGPFASDGLDCDLIICKVLYPDKYKAYLEAANNDMKIFRESNDLWDLYYKILQEEYEMW